MKLDLKQAFAVPLLCGAIAAGYSANNGSANKNVLESSPSLVSPELLQRSLHAPVVEDHSTTQTNPWTEGLYTLTDWKHISNEDQREKVYPFRTKLEEKYGHDLGNKIVNAIIRELYSKWINIPKDVDARNTEAIKKYQFVDTKSLQGKFSKFRELESGLETLKERGFITDVEGILDDCLSKGNDLELLSWNVAKFLEASEQIANSKKGAFGRLVFYTLHNQPLKPEEIPGFKAAVENLEYPKEQPLNLPAPSGNSFSA